ncbi:MAG: right-handed parallel beta-helix repeat-containing protein [Verrucomicrobiae bacterium]|nr:right-handed parallel beta-helix repeat-containing protein [Verrucomicrobiae bacterium]
MHLQPRSIVTIAIALAAAFSLRAQPSAAEPGQKLPEPQLVEASIDLPQGAVLRRPLVVVADDITIDGKGAILIGPAAPGDPKTGYGIGLVAEGRRNITLRNFTIRGFQTAIAIRGGGGWKIENCDFSDNYHDPDFDWGDGDRVGGMILSGVDGAEITACRAQRNWNGLDLDDCRNIKVDRCDFSHCSNVCLKMWRACNNQILRSNLSYGLRIREGEVHARDSTSVLIESGSNDNLFEDNDITHGGDGVFIRVLNGWISTGNIFRRNDCSHAHNNGFESWSPGNTYIDNKSNHCSYGFWLGGSDRTVLVGNEASHNGLATGSHNAPESDFGHGGIVIVHGTGTHTLIDSNTCIGNNGGGIVFRGDLGSNGKDWRMRHLVIQRNRLEGNRYGIFGRFTDGLDLSSNRFANNDEDTHFEDVTDLHQHDGAGAGDKRPEVELDGPEAATVGELITFTATAKAQQGGGTIHYRWTLDGAITTGNVLRCSFDNPGLKSLSLTVDDGKLANIAHRDIYVTAAGEHPATDRDIGRWESTSGSPSEKVAISTDPSSPLVGDTAVKVHAEPYSGNGIQVNFSNAVGPVDLSTTSSIGFWLRTENHNNHGFSAPTPIVGLHSGKAAWKYTPIRADGLPRNVLGGAAASASRGGWTYVEVPIQVTGDWHRSVSHEGARPPFVSQRLRFETHDCGLATEDGTGLATDGKELFCADRGRAFHSRDGKSWVELPGLGESLGTNPSWNNGLLTFAPSLGAKGSLILAIEADAATPLSENGRQLAIFDLAKGSWHRHPTIVALDHGGVVVDNHLFGLAHAIGPNFGGPLCRVGLAADGQAADDHSVLAGVQGDDAWWFSRAAQLALLNGKIYATKNDWITPQPAADTIGDRLLAFDPATFQPSKFSGTRRWIDQNWQAAETPCTDLGPLPFEIGHGSCLVPLPAGWGDGLVGDRGGLFLIAGCSPSNHEGQGRPSSQWAIYDIAQHSYLEGELPEPTGTGTAACLFKGNLVIKRGGVLDKEGDQQIWTVTPIDAATARDAVARQIQDLPDLRHVDRLSLQFATGGSEPVTIWVDGLHIDDAKATRDPDSH